VKTIWPREHHRDGGELPADRAGREGLVDLHRTRRRALRAREAAEAAIAQDLSDFREPGSRPTRPTSGSRRIGLIARACGRADMDRRELRVQDAERLAIRRSFSAPAIALDSLRLIATCGPRGFPGGASGAMPEARLRFTQWRRGLVAERDVLGLLQLQHRQQQVIAADRAVVEAVPPRVTSARRGHAIRGNGIDRFTVGGRVFPSREGADPRRLRGSASSQRENPRGCAAAWR
jgi:hypothetical protein